MGDITISTAWGWLLAACAAIAAIAKAAEIVKGLGSKGELARKNEQLTQKVHDLEEANNMTMRALLALIRHGIDGNNIDGLKSMRDEMQEYLIKR